VQLELALLALDGTRPAGTLEWVSAAAPAVTRAEMVKNTQQHRDLLRQLGERLPPEAPVTAGPHAHLSQRSQNALSALIPAQIVLSVVFGVRSGLRHPRQLTGHAIAGETFNTVTYVLRAARAVQRRRPRIAAGRVLSAAGSLARLRAASAEPLP